MYELKTKLNDSSVDSFLKSIEADKKRSDSLLIVDLMREETGEEPKMWGSSIIGFGSYHYKSQSGQEGDWMLVGFSPRKQNLTLYIMPGFERYGDLMDKLGKYSTGKSCLYIKKVEDVDLDIVRELVNRSVEVMRKSAGNVAEE